MTPEIERAYEILGVEADASPARVHAAYLALLNRYNPAKVASLDVGFTLLAVRKLAEVTAAFKTVGAALAEAA